MYCYLLQILVILSVFQSIPGTELCEAYYKVCPKCQEIYEKISFVAAGSAPQRLGFRTISAKK
jgi:hypothetical protein